MLTLTQLRVLDAVRRHGTVTAAARELHYSQPSLSHHLARLEIESGAQLFQKAGRGLRFTEAGALLAERAAEIVGRVEAATTELATLTGLRAGRVRVAGFNSVMSSLVPLVVRDLGAASPGLELSLFDTHPEEALAMLRAGQVDVALIFRHEETATEPDGIRLVHLLDDQLHLLSRGGGTTPAAHRDSPWIAGCERCRSHLVELCRQAGFTPRTLSTTDDMVVMQALVAAGMGVTTIPELALRAHRNPAITVTALPGQRRRIFAATYGEPPDPPATVAVLDALVAAAQGLARAESLATAST